MGAEPELEPLVEALDDLPAPNLLVVTGAGISLASGIPTFRGPDPGAVWSESVTRVGTFEFFERDPVASWRWYLERFDGLGAKEPNPGHRALAALEAFYAARRGEFLLVTQNVDGLHRRAGSHALVEIHGRADRVRCVERWCTFGAPEGWLPRAEVDFEPFRADPCRATLPTCPECGSLIRAHVLWFDETYGQHLDYGYLRAREAASSFELALFVGTSFSVGITNLLLQQGLARECPMFVIDPGDAPDLEAHYSGHFGGRFPPARLTHLQAQAEVVLPALCRELGVSA
ncbi:MAG: RNA polymerase subunit sigma [Planctomycetes bacterium]|nr:RNA polymerase subunit sigma [Planctomycetota bacterium]